MYAESEDGTYGETPVFEADSPEEAKSLYKAATPSPLVVSRVEAEEPS